MPRRPTIDGEPFEGGHCLSEAEILEFAVEGMAPGLRAVAEAHLKDCDDCRDQVARVMHLHLPLAGLARAAEPPPGLRRRVLRAVRSRRI